MPIVPELNVAPIGSDFGLPLPARAVIPKNAPHRFVVIWRRFILTVIIAIVLLWPAYINGGPFWFPDSSNYVRSADAATVVLTGSPSEWSDRLRIGGDGPVAKLVSPTITSRERAELKPTRPVLSGRSIYYGFLIYLPMRYFGPWGGVFLQSLLTAAFLLYCTSITLRGRAVPTLTRLLGAFAVVLFLTPLPFYTSMLMPDVYAGLIVLTLCTTIVFWDKLVAVERAGLVLVSGAMASFHSTNLLLTLFLGTFGFIMYFTYRLAWRPVLIAVSVVSLGVVAGLVFNLAVEHSLHKKPISPPFLSARTTAAGPGTRFLKSDCARDPDAWALCSDLQKLPLASDTFLWSENPKAGVFQVASEERQQRLSRDDTRFFLALIRHDPWGVFRSSVSATLEELGSFDMVNFNYPPKDADELFTKYPPGIAHSIASSRAAQGRMPTSFSVGSSVAITLASLAVLGGIFFGTARGKFLIRADYVRFALLLLLGVLCNAAICGSLSGPHARYQMRLIWLLPFAALVIIGAAARLKGGSPKLSQISGGGAK